MIDFWIILTASLVATTTAILGCFLIMRKMAMIGDAISHAVLPGIVIAYYISHSRASFPILIGAAASGMVVTYLIQFFHQKVKLQQDASIGISYTFLFAIGIILISLFSGNVDLDQDCVLYGEIAYVPLDNLSIGGLYAGPRQVWILGTTLIIISTSVIVAYRKLVLTTFDPAFASAMGISVVLWQYYLMAGVSLTTVVSFESVGAVLVIAFLSGPAATAFLLTKDFKKMLYLAVGFGISASILGYYTAVWLAGSIAGAIATIIGLQFAIAFIYIQFLKKARISETLENKALTEV
ncbi:MAG: metal ABC transporter permease [Bacteroidetes bacterium]|jgi:manganese/zinc/iron transport system permease protein|nr:metal ABC transporter permease [Bacteroidota bacterium]